MCSPRSGQSDLAFREDETRALLDGLGIDLDPVYVGRLVERTEGWAAGLRLAALELQGAADPTGFVDAFSGDDHAVAAYLLDEVIDRLAPELLDFLVRVSVLDVVSADLADALTGRRSGAATLADLAASNLFVHAVGPAGQWYRLHRLLADLLRSRITEPRMLRDLHRRAAEWYLHQKMPLEAVRYALRGGLWPLAAEVLGRHVLALVVRGNPRNIDMLLSAVPRDALLSHPELAAALAGARIMQGSPAEVGELTAAAHAGADRLPGPRAERLRVVLHLIEIGHARARGDLAGVAAACRQIPTDTTVLAALGLAAWDVVPAIVLGNAGTAELWTGDLAEAENHLRAAGDIDTSGDVLRPQLNAAAHLALLHCERGDLDAAQNQARAVVEYAVDAGWTVSAQVVAAYLTLAWVALDRDDHAEADGWLGRVAQVEAVIPEPHIQLAAAGLTALRRADAGDPVGALSGLQLTTARLAGSTPPALTDRLLQVEADLLRRIGDVARASDVLAGLRGPATASSARAVARLHLSTGDLAAAEAGAGPVPGRRRDGARACRGRHPAQPDRRGAGPRGRAVAAGGRTARSGSARDAAALPGRGGGAARPARRQDRSRDDGRRLRRGPATADVDTGQPTAGRSGCAADRPRAARSALPREHAVQHRDRLGAVPVGQHGEDPPADDLPQARRRRSTRRHPAREGTAPALTSSSAAAGVAPAVGRSLVLLVDHATQRGQRLLRLFDEVLQTDDRRVGVGVRDDLVLLLGYVGIVYADNPIAVPRQNLESVVVATVRCHHVIVPESDQRHTAQRARQLPWWPEVWGWARGRVGSRVPTVQRSWPLVPVRDGQVAVLRAGLRRRRARLPRDPARPGEATVRGRGRDHGAGDGPFGSRDRALLPGVARGRDQLPDRTRWVTLPRLRARPDVRRARAVVKLLLASTDPAAAGGLGDPIR